MKDNVMKPYYSIKELEQILEEPFYDIASGLVSSGAALMYYGQPADVSQWKSFIPVTLGNNKLTFNLLKYPFPDPAHVIVNSEVLTQLWKDCIIEDEQKNGLSTTDKVRQPFFDKESSTYPPELDFALQAWREVSANEGKGKPKARIKEWLNSHTKLSAEAKERIATVANWSKTGGATRAD